jgi:hypothetical protein
LARQGEVGGGEKSIKQTGKPPSELAQKWRERVKTRTKNYEESRR